MWGTRWRQRLRLAPLYLALQAAETLGAAWHRKSTIDRSVTRDPPVSNRAPWRPGIAVVIPDRDAAEMLVEALSSVSAALERIDEPHQVIVVANGTPESTYAGVRASFPTVEFVHSVQPLAFSAAIARGLARVRHDWVYLMNNDM